MNQVIEKLINEKVVAVVRAETKEQAKRIVEAIYQGGIKAIEVTFTVPNAEELIQELANEYDDILVGAGTVLNMKTCKLAIENGATYIVSPGFDMDSAIYCDLVGVPYIPGCMTITEMMTATSHGVELIKLFPGSEFSPNFIKSVKGPLPDIKIMPTGGVNLENIKSWFANGVSAVGIGSALTKPAQTNDFEEITRIANLYIEKVKEV